MKHKYIALYHCTACFEELTRDELLAGGVCPYCGNTSDGLIASHTRTVRKVEVPEPVPPKRYRIHRSAIPFIVLGIALCLFFMWMTWSAITQIREAKHKANTPSQSITNTVK